MFREGSYTIQYRKELGGDDANPAITTVSFRRLRWWHGIRQANKKEGANEKKQITHGMACTTERPSRAGQLAASVTPTTGPGQRTNAIA